MTFRDDNDALRARISELEFQLASSQRKLGALSAPPKGEAGGLLSPRTTIKRHTFPSPLSTRHFEQAADIIRTLPHAGPITLVGRVLTSTNPHLDIRLAPGPTGQMSVTWTHVDSRAKVVLGSVVVPLFLGLLLFGSGAPGARSAAMVTSIASIAMGVLLSACLTWQRTKLAAQYQVAFDAITALGSSEPEDELSLGTESADHLGPVCGPLPHVFEEFEELLPERSERVPARSKGDEAGRA